MFVRAGYDCSVPAGAVLWPRPETFSVQFFNFSRGAAAADMKSANPDLHVLACAIADVGQQLVPNELLARSDPLLLPDLQRHGIAIW